jgi:hypothetical protein
MLDFRVKVKKYGDRVLATIEDFLSKHPNPRRNSSGSGSNEHTEAAKKRRGCSTAASSNCDDFEDRTVQSKKRAAKTRSTPRQVVSDAASVVNAGAWTLIWMDLKHWTKSCVASKSQWLLAGFCPSGNPLRPNWARAASRLLTYSTNLDMLSSIVVVDL